MASTRPLPEKVTILIARLSYNGYERVEIANWLVQTAMALDDHPRVGNISHNIVTGYPTPRVRNQILITAGKIGADFTVMIDDDMVPDVHAKGRAVGYDHLTQDSDQITFFPSALDFALAHQGPCVIAAPYCAGPPEERVLVSRFREVGSFDPNTPTAGTVNLESFSRDDAAGRTGFEMVSALPTGLMMIDMRAMDSLTEPWFAYEYKDKFESVLASTEDTVFSRNLGYLGIPQYVAWGSWAAHYKGKPVGRPRRYPLLAVPKAVRQAIRDEIEREDRDRRPADVVNERSLSVLAGMDDDPPPVEPLADEPFANDFEPAGMSAAYEIMSAQWLDDAGNPVPAEAINQTPPCGKCPDGDIMKCLRDEPPLG